MNLKKLYHSKWTALNPVNKEKHFLVVKVIKDQNDEQKVLSVVIEAVISKRRVEIKHEELTQPSLWQAGWK